MTIMKSLDRNELRELVEDRAPLSVSLYMPTHEKGKEIHQDPISLKNLVKDAEQQLSSLGCSESERREQLRVLHDLLDDSSREVWQNSSKGFAAFANGNATRIFRLPISFDRLVVVANRFHTKPLLEYLQGDGHYFVLAVSQNRVRLLEGSKHGLHEVDVEALPQNLVDALNIDEFQSSLQFHSHATGMSDHAKDRAIYHGHGGGSDADQKSDLLHYFRRLDDALQQFFREERAPLVFAGVDYLFPIFKEANSYNRLVEDLIPGNPDALSADELHDPAWEIVRRVFAEDRKECHEKYGTYAAQNKASDNLTEVITEARNGRVETLLALKNSRVWGTVDADSGIVKKCQDNRPENEDLVDHAAAQTLLNGGSVYLIDSEEEMPTSKPIAAIYRY